MYLLFSLSSLLIIQYPTVQAQQYRFHYCYGDNYTTNSTFQANLNLLLPSLTSTDPSNIKNGYYEATVGQNQDIVYGSLQCRGDVPLDFCQVCVQRKVAVNNGSTKFAAGDTNLTDTTKLYGYVQCTADISSSDCNRGLLETISELRDCCDVYEGGQSLKPSFNVRFEFYPLFPSMASPSPPPQSSSPAPHVSPPSSTNTTPPYSNGKKSFVLPIIIVVPSVVAVLLAICFWFFCFRRKKRQTENSYGADDEIQSTESFQFNFSTISVATNNFSEANKLGEGGFGSVYKVWRHWNNGSTIDILDPTLKDICPTNEVVRCIHVALLCVQENVADRPTMPTVVQMLNTYSAINPDLPSAPAFLADSKKDESISEAGTWSVNEVTITEPYPR
ncbi:hypothetical protein MKW92_003249 [Papaver armeniacum]|nr:hypothetical protein MKW92_003249 [Papaver armeniacum]